MNKTKKIVTINNEKCDVFEGTIYFDESSTQANKFITVKNIFRRMHFNEELIMNSNGKYRFPMAETISRLNENETFEHEYYDIDGGVSEYIFATSDECYIWLAYGDWKDEPAYLKALENNEEDK